MYALLPIHLVTTTLPVRFSDHPSFTGEDQRGTGRINGCSRLTCWWQNWNLSSIFPQSPNLVIQYLTILIGDLCTVPLKRARLQVSIRMSCALGRGRAGTPRTLRLSPRGLAFCHCIHVTEWRNQAPGGRLCLGLLGGGPESHLG